MSDLTLPEVRRTLYRVLLDAELREDQATEQNVRYALHLLSAWSDADLEAACRALRQEKKLKGRLSPVSVLGAVDPDRVRPEPHTLVDEQTEAPAACDRPGA